MCFKKLLFNKQYAKRRRTFYSSTIAGLYAGIPISIFIVFITLLPLENSLIKKELFKLEGVLILFGLILMIVFYYLGKWLMGIVKLGKKEELIGFKINYFAAIYSAIWVGTLLIFKDKKLILVVITIIFIISYFLIEYLLIKTRKHKKKDK